MNQTYCQNWEPIRERFEGWWNHEDIGRPLMSVRAKGKPGNTAPLSSPEKTEDLYLDVEYRVRSYRNYCETHYFMGDAFPSLNADLGPGSLALYLGGEPIFAPDTVWYKPVLSEASAYRDLHFDPNNFWYQKHLQMIRDLKRLAAGDFMADIPDLIENIDILAALRDPQEFCFDLIDSREDVEAGIKIIDDLYFQYYDAFYRIIEEDGGSSYTAFQILGKGKTAKVQCDFSALISPDMYRQLVQPSIRKQCRKLDHSLYHLDGPDAIKHVDAIMEIPELQALQWTCGAGQPDGTCEKWDIIYDKVRAAGKSLWIMVYDGNAKDWMAGTQRILKRCGRNGIYFLYPDFDDRETAQQFLDAFEP